MADSNDPQQALLKALQHPLRRLLLGHYVESKERLSPKMLAALAGKPLPSVSYHVRLLAELGAVEIVEERPAGGSIEHLYRATAIVRETPWVLAMLEASPSQEPIPKKGPSGQKRSKGE